MVDCLELQLAPVDLLQYSQVLSRVHQKGGARIAWEIRGVRSVLLVLDVADRTHLVRLIADDESATFERKLTLGLGRYCFERLPVYHHRLHLITSPAECRRALSQSTQGQDRLLSAGEFWGTFLQ